MNTRSVTQSAAMKMAAFFLVFIGSWASSDDGDNHQAPQTGWIDLGTSGSNIEDRSSIYCCGGTLGALVEADDGSGQYIQYILSNNHVLARFNQGIVDVDQVSQPGSIDQNCAQAGVVAILSDFVKIQTSKGRNIKWNVVDAAIAQVQPDVKMSGNILDIGPISSTIVAAALDQAVQKSGRTTGHTTGIVKAVDVSVSVGYSKECGGAPNQIAYFKNQIRIEPGSFSAGGDSGSLILESGKSGLPSAVGLLFAGSSSSTLANPIDAVLGSLGVSLVNGTPVPIVDPGWIAGTVTSAEGGSPVMDATVSVDTGQSTLTGTNGMYDLEVPAGSQTVTVSASGFVTRASVVNVVKTQDVEVNFALTVAEVATQSLVKCVIFDTSGGRNGDRNILFTVSVVDDLNVPISGAIVDIRVDRNGALFGNGAGAATDSAGEVTYVSSRAPSGDYVLMVTNVVAAGDLDFDSDSTPPNLFKKGTDEVPAEFCNFYPPAPESVSTQSSPGNGQGAVQRAKNVKAAHSANLFAIPGVVGHGVGLSANGSPVIEVYIANENASTRAQIPNALDNVPVRVVVTGVFEAY